LTIQQMKIQVAGDFVANGDPANAIPPGVERGRKYSDAQLAWQNSNDTTGDPALGRHTD
jgi:hypothetical protein